MKVITFLIIILICACSTMLLGPQKNYRKICEVNANTFSDDLIVFTHRNKS